MPKMKTNHPKLQSRRKPVLKLKLTPTQLAYERLGVDMSTLDSTPKITHILSAMPGGIKQALVFLRGSADEDARKILEHHDKLSARDRKLVEFEAYILAANLTPRRALEIITGACFEQSGMSSALIAAASHPLVTGATVASACHPDGHADRKLLHQHAGFIPVPKNNVTNIFGGAQLTSNSTTTVNALGPGAKQANVSPGDLAGVESKMSRITSRFNQERLRIASEEPPPITQDIGMEDIKPPADPNEPDAHNPMDLNQTSEGWE